MASTLKLADLPIATLMNSDDIMLVSDMTYGVSKKITLQTLNSQLSLSSLSDYQSYLTEVESINDQLDLIVGDGTVVHSLSDMDELIVNLQDRIEALRVSLTGVIDTLRENVDLEIMHRNRLDRSVIEKVEANEDMLVNSGLASGFLYVKEFKGG